MNIELKETDFPVRIYTEPPMTDEELLRVRTINDTVSIQREPDGGILVRMLAPDCFV